MRRLERPIRAPGIAKADERTLRVVSLRADAFIEKLYVNETGKHVEKGEPLFRIYSPAHGHRAGRLPRRHERSRRAVARGEPQRRRAEAAQSRRCPRR